MGEVISGSYPAPKEIVPVEAFEFGFEDEVEDE